MAVDFPWEKLKPGQGFFVPCLDTARMREMGLRAALPLRIKAAALPAIWEGRIGVWFYLKAAPPRVRVSAAKARSPAA